MGMGPQCATAVACACSLPSACAGTCERAHANVCACACTSVSAHACTTARVRVCVCDVPKKVSIVIYLSADLRHHEYIFIRVIVYYYALFVYLR